MSGLVCPIDLAITGSSLSSVALSISTGYLPSKWGKTIPGYGSYSDNTGKLFDLKKNLELIGLDLIITGDITLPAAGPNLKRAVGEFIIPLQASLDGDTVIMIKGTPGTTNIPFLANNLDGTCSIFH